MTCDVTAGVIVAALAALLHVYIFVMESLTWTTPRTRAIFGTTEEEARDHQAAGVQPGLLQPVPGHRHGDRRGRGVHRRASPWAPR